MQRSAAEEPHSKTEHRVCQQFPRGTPTLSSSSSAKVWGIRPGPPARKIRKRPVCPRFFHRDMSDGGYPQAGVIIDRTGRVCGTTLNGGPGTYGTAFCLTPPSAESGSWNEAILYGFKNNNQYGADPVGGLAVGSRGNLYGTTNAFGAFFGGTVFELKPKGAAWVVSLLYSFAGPPDGEFPAASLIFDKSGNLYSTTQAGGNKQSCQSGCGTVFEVSP